MSHQQTVKRHELEAAEDWRAWAATVPPVSIPLGATIQVVPPFAGAIARMYVRKNGLEVSIYLDVFDRLGIMDEPYWELYDGEECYRFLLEDTDGLEECMAQVFTPGEVAP